MKKLEIQEEADPQGLEDNVDGFDHPPTSSSKPFRGFKHGSYINVLGF